MENHKKPILVLIFLILVLSNSVAQIKLPVIISSNMVLQRNTEVKLWGWSKPGDLINVEVSWNDEKVSTKTNESGKWQLTVNTSESKEPQKVVIYSRSDKIELVNVLLGEVWICSGQSNMEQPIKGFKGQPTFGSSEALLNAKNPNIRLFRITNHGSKVPLDNPINYKSWVEATTESVADFGAIAYFFGNQLQSYLDVPVGLIHTSRGASSIQAWMSSEVLAGFEQVNLTDVEITSQKTGKIPTVLFNAMLNPLIPYTIKGAIWYQGESNRMDPEGYKKLFPAMVQDWRSRWGQGNFPFYFVQIAPFAYGGNSDFQTAKNSAFMREAQVQCVDLIPNSGIAITTDVGDQHFIHPPGKKEVADRLLKQALGKTYGVEGLDFESPSYSCLEKQDGGLLLKFDHVETGLYASPELRDFEIAGDDHVFYPAKAKIVNRTEVLVETPKVASPVAVRYAWSNWVQGTLFSGSLLPVSSFRSDDWTVATRAE